MHRPNPRIIAFFVLSAIVLASSSAALAASWPNAIGAAHRQSAKLIGEAATADLAEAAVDYQLATWLDPQNQAGYLGLARTQIATGHAEAALIALERAGEGSNAATLRIRTLLELGRSTEAADRARTLARPGRKDADVVLAALTFAIAGRAAGIPALTTLVSSPEALQSLARIEAGQVPFAGELYAAGLPESSRSLLIKLPTSFERNLLLAHIAYDRHTPDDLSSATDYLNEALALNPSGLEARKLLVAVYTDRGLPTDATNQSVLIQKLEAGKP